MSNQIFPKSYVPKNREELIQQLDDWNCWVEKALVRLYERQTSQEQATAQTRVHNGVGFTAHDAKFMTKWAQHVLSPENKYPKGNKLPPGILRALRKTGTDGRHRLGKYARQLFEIIQEAQDRRAAAQS